MTTANIQYQVNLTEHDSWSGPSRWSKCFDTRQEAESYIAEVNSKLGVLAITPEYYNVADTKVTVVEVDDNGKAIG